MSFDIVIPLGPNERLHIDKQIEYTKKNVIGYRNIYIVTNNYDNLQINGCIIIDESVYPFKMTDIASYFEKYNGKKNRNGWYLQQLLKLYAGFVIDGLLENYLIIDADVFFLKPTNFMNENKYIFTTSNENHLPYFKHMLKMNPLFTKQINKSGISHHMIFNQHIIKKMFEMVENIHKIPFWMAFIQMVDEHKNHNINVEESGASEYEMYFNFVVSNNPNNIVIRELNWSNKPRNYNVDQNNNSEHDFVAVCLWIK